MYVGHTVCYRIETNLISLNAQACKVIYVTLKEGFRRCEGDLHLLKLLSPTGQDKTCKFQGINSYKNHHGVITDALLTRQLNCTISICKKKIG